MIIPQEPLSSMVIGEILHLIQGADCWASQGRLDMLLINLWSAPRWDISSLIHQLASW